MSLNLWLRKLQAFSRANQLRRRHKRPASTKSPRSVPAETLEERTLLAACLFVDWGDNFPAGTLTTTLGGLRDVADDPVDNTQDILGPQLEDATGFNSATTLNIVRQNFTSADRDAMMANVARAYLPLDVHVINLTSTPQLTPDGRTVTAASSMADVVTTLRGLPVASKDAYIFVARFVADPGGPNQKIYGPLGGGTSPVSALDTSDLVAAANIHDDVAVVYTDSLMGYNFNTMNNIAHEAGHNFGLQHSLTNSSGNAATDLLHRSEVSSYLNTNFTTSSIAFSRYPVIRGDDNSPPAGLVNYNDLEARTGDFTPWDQLATDPNVGPKPSRSFVSGTGAHDVIQLTRTTTNIQVSVTAYADAAYTTPIVVPGAGGTAWSYALPLGTNILLYGGFSNDTIRINGDLGVDVEIDGMIGTDQLIVDVASAVTTTWTPNPTASPGIDRNDDSGSSPLLDYGGTLSWNSTNVVLKNFEPTSSLSLLNPVQIIVNGSAGSDLLQISKSGPENRIDGLVSGTSAIPLLVVNPSLIVVNTNNGNDSLTINHTTGFVNNSIVFNGGSPANSGEPSGDTLQIVGAPPVALGPTARETYVVGITEDAGFWTIDPDGNMGPGAGGSANGDEMLIQFTGLEPVDTDIPVALFDVIWNDSTTDAIRIENGGALPGGNSLRVVDLNSTFETFRFANKQTVRLNLNGGADSAILNYTVSAAALSTLELYGHGAPALPGIVPEDNAADRFAAIANTAGVVTNLFGQGGNDRLNNFAVIAPFGSSSLALINGPIQFRGGENPADNDEILLTNALAPAGPVVTLNSFTLVNAAPAPFTWTETETFVYGGSQASDTIDVLSTAAETNYAIYTNDGPDDVVTIGNTRAAFQTPTFNGSLTSIQGSILVAHDHAPNAGPAANDTLNIDASGDAALAGPGAALISNIGFAGFTFDGFTDIAPTTRLAGFAPASIDYQHGTNIFAETGDRLEFLNVRTSRGADPIRIADTTASVATVIDAREGDDRLVILADNLSASNTILGFDGNDDFSLAIAVHIGNTGVVSPTSLAIEGNNNPAADSANRDRLNIIDSNTAFARDLKYDFLDSQGDLDILAGSLNSGLFGPEDGGLTPLSVRTMETLRFDSSGVNDVVSISGTSADDILTVALTPSLPGVLTAANSAFVFLGGNPYLTTPGAALPQDSLAGNLPGRAGGGSATDLLINGIAYASGLTLDGSAAPTIGNRAVVQSLSELNLIDPIALTAGLDIFNLSVGAGVVVPGAGSGNAFDALSFNGATVTDADLGTVTSSPDQINAHNIAFGPLLPVTLIPNSFTNGSTPVVRPGLILNAGDENNARPSGIADNLAVNLHSVFSIAINGNLPVLGALASDGFHAGDQLSIASAESFSIWSDKTTLPHLTVAAGNSPYTATISSIERTRLYPGNGTLNLIGDQNNPSIDQTDHFKVLGVDVDTAGSVDAGVQEMAIQINGSAPVLADGVQRLNVYGFDLFGQNLNSPNPLASDNPVGPPSVNIDTLDITPFADNAGGPAANAPRGWGVQTIFNEGYPASTDGDPSDLLIVHTSIGPSTGLNVYGRGIASDNLEIHPAGPDNGEVRIRNAADGSAIAVIAWIGNTDIIIADDDGAVSDYDSLSLFGTDPASNQTSGNDTFEANFAASGTVNDPMLSVRDANSGQLLYRLRNLQLPNQSSAPLYNINFNLLGGDDSMTLLSHAFQSSNGLPGPHVTISGGSDDDSLAITYPASEGLQPGHVSWDGGTGSDSLSFLQPPESSQIARSVNYSPGPIPGNGRIEHDFDGTLGVVDFSNLEPVFDFLNAASITVDAGNNSNQITYYTDYGVGSLSNIINGGVYSVDGVYLNVPLIGGAGSGARADITVAGGAVVAATLVNDGGGYIIGDFLSAPTASLGGGQGGFLIRVTSFSGTVAVDNQEVLVFANKNTLILNAQAGSDHVSINNPITPAGLSSILVNGGDPDGSDSLVVHGLAGVFDNLVVAPASTGSGAFFAINPGLVPVRYSGTEHLHVVDLATDREQLNFNDTPGIDTFTWSPGVTADSGLLSGQAIGGPDFNFVPVTWSGITGGIVASTAARDTLVVNGTSGDDVFDISRVFVPATSPAIQLTSGAITYTTVYSGAAVSTDQILVRGLAGNDAFKLNFNPLSSNGLLTPIFIEGGESGQFSDSLEFLPNTNSTTTLDLAASTITSTGANPVTFSGIEALTITGANASADVFLVNNLGAPTGLLSVTLNPADTAGPDDADSIDVSLGSGPDTLDYTPLSPSSGLLQRRDSGTQIRVLNLNAQVGDLTLAGGGSLDALNVIAPSGNDRIDLLRVGNSASVSVVASGNPTAGTVWLPVDFSLLIGPADFDNLSINGGAGDDLLRIDNSGGLLTLNSGINYDGGSGSDSLLLLGSTVVNSAAYTPGSNPGNGRIDHAITGPPAQSQSINFANLEPVIDLVVASFLTINANPADNAISYTQGPNSGTVNSLNPAALLTGNVAVDNFEPYEFANKNQLIIQALAGSDAISINNPATPSGLQSILVSGGDPEGSDSLTVHGRAGVFDNLFVIPSATGSGSFFAANPGLVPVLYSGTEHLHVVDLNNDREQLNFIGTQVADTFTWSPGTTTDAGSLTGQAVGGPDFTFVPVTWSGVTGAIVAATSARDTLVLNGTSADDFFSLSALSAPSIFPATAPGIQLTTGAIAYTPVFSGNVVSTDQILLRGLAGNDSFKLNFNPLSSIGTLTPIFIEGGESGQFSDSLEFLPNTNSTTTLDLATSNIFSTGANPITYSGLEALTINGSNTSSDSLVVNNLGASTGLLSVTLNAADTAGPDDTDSIDVSLTAGPDALDYTPLSSSSALLQNREGGTQIRILNLNAQIGDLTLAGGGNIDTLHVIAPSSNDRIDLLRSGNFASVSVVAAGNPAGGSAWLPVDFSLLAGPASFDNLSISGNAGDDLLRVDNSGGLITLNSGIHYDGGSGRDSLLLLGSNSVNSANYSVGPNPGDGRITHSITGPPAQTQSTTFSNLEPLVDLVAAASLIITATNADNAISYAAGPNNGVVTPLNPAGLLTGYVTIDNFEPVEFANKTAIIIQALAGSDTISLSQPTSPAALSAITVDGGLPAAETDKVLISGTSLAEAFNYSPISSDAAIITGSGPASITVVTTEHVSLAGQGGADSLTWTSPVGTDIIRFTPAGNDSSGSISASRSSGGILLPMSFTNVATAGPAANLIFRNVAGGLDDQLTIVGSNSNDVVLLSASGLVTLRNAQNALISPIIDTANIGFTNGIAQLAFQLLAGDDVVSVPGNHRFNTLTIEAGEPSQNSDVLNIAGSGSTLAIALITQSVIETGFGPIAFTGIEQLNIGAANANLALSTTNVRDFTAYYPEGPGAGTLTNDHNSPRIFFTSCGTLSVDQLGGADVLEIHGTSLSENIIVNLPVRLLTVGGLESLNFNANTEAVRAVGQAGNDALIVTPDPVIPAYIDGADPIGITPGDSLTILAGGGGVVFEPGPESDEGAFIVGINQRVSFDHIEALTVSGPGGAWIAGTGADDDITIIARDASTHPLADGIRDFTVQINAGPQILWLDSPLLFINAAAGDDDVIMRAPAPNNAAWNVASFISGGPPAAGPYSDGDRFELETPQNTPDTILYTPSSPDAGLLIINESGSGVFTPAVDSPIQIGGPFSTPPLQGLPPLDPGGFETLVYDGEAGNDSVLLFGDAGGPAVNDIFTHSPGTEPDDGSILINSLLALHYTDLGLSGSITINGLGGSDTLAVDGTAANDDLTVATITGTVSHILASGAARVTIAQANLEKLTLNALNGSDTFRLPGNSPSPIVVQGGSPDVGSDTVIFTSPGNTIVNLGLATIDDDGVNPPADVSYTDIEQILLSAAGFTLTVAGTAFDDILTYVPQGANSGQVQANNAPPVVRFNSVAAFAISGAAGTADVVILQGTSNHDVITADSPTRTAAVTNAVGTLLQPVLLTTDVEILRIESGLGNDTIVVVPGLPVGPSTPAPQSLPTNLLIDVNGGPPSASDALVIAGSAAGATLPASDFVVHNRSRTADSGRIRVFRSIPGGGIIPLPDISYSDVEIVSPLVAINANPAIGPQLLQQGPDLYEQNESFQNAAYLGSASVINASNLALFPDANEHFFVPNDIDFYRVVAKDTGTLDFQVYFNTYNGLLPGGGDIDIRILDSDGTVIAGTGSPALNSAFGIPNAPNPTITPPVLAGNNADERLRIPVIAGQTYYLQVFNPTATRFNTNGYNLTITNTPAPVPIQLELNDALVNGAITAAGVPVGAETAFTIPAGLLNSTPNFYVGKTLHFLTGTNAGLSLRITSQAAPTTLRVATTGLRSNGAPGDAIRIESSDTGRSRFDNTTRDNTPLILFRLDDNLLQQDLPGNPTPGPTPDQPTRIPWNSTFTQTAGPSIAVPPAADPALYVAGSIPGLTAGYRVAIYEEGTTTTPTGPGPNGLWGYATMIAPGVYQFNFGNTTTNNLFGPAALTNGSHFLTARVEIIDPAATPGPVNVQARGIRSTPLEIIVDAEAPTAAFGDLVSIVDGLHPSSDSSVPGIAPTISDRVTNDTTPAFWGTAEANSIVRAYLDVDASGTISGSDILLGQAVAVPNDGGDQAPFGQWQLTSTIDLNSPLVLTALVSSRDGLRRILISAEDTAGNLAMPAAAATPQLSLDIFIDTQGPQLIDPDNGGALQTIQIANPAPLGPANSINSYNLFAVKPANAAQGPTPLVSGLTIHIRDLPARVIPFIYQAIQAPPLAGSIIPPLASVSPLAGAPAIAALAPIPVPGGASALNPADFSVIGDANGPIPILSAYFVPVAAPGPAASPALGYIVLTFHSAAAGDFLPDDRFTLNIRDTLVDPANNALDGENQGLSVPAGNLFTPTGDGKPGGSFVARFTVDSRPEAATFGQGGIFVDANGNWTFDPGANDASNRDLTFQFGIDTDFIFSGRHSAGQTLATRTTNGFDKLAAYGRISGAYRWLLDTNDDGVADQNIPQATGFTVAGITFAGNGIPFAGNFVGAAGSADEIGIFDGVNWFLDTAAPFNQITPADTAFTGTLRGLPLTGDFDGDGLTDLAVHSASANRFQFDYAAVAGLAGTVEATINHGYSGVLERPIAGDLNLDGITDIGLAVPNQDGVSTNSLFSWYVLQSTGAPAPGTPNNLNHSFSPLPLGPDLFRQFGNNLAVPMLANYDPPPADRPNSAPTLELPQLVTLADQASQISIPLNASDPDGNPITLSATADSLQWHLKNSLGLKQAASYSENWGGRGEKWIRGSGNLSYFITPTGGLYRWDGRAVKLPTTKVTGTLLATLTPVIHQNPRLLTDAVQTNIPVSTSISGGNLNITTEPGYQQPFIIRIHATDGVAANTHILQIDRAAAIAVRVDNELGLSIKTASANYNWGGLKEKWLAGSDGQWYFITSDGILRLWDRSRQARGPQVAQLDPAFYQNPNLLQHASAIDLDQRFGFKSDGKLALNWGGRMEKWFRDKDNNWLFILPNGEVRRWDGNRGANGDLIHQLDPLYYQSPAKLYNALDDVFSSWMELYN